MRFRVVSVVMLSLLITSMLTLAFDIHARARIVQCGLPGGRSTFPVIVDGKVTSSEEWSDTEYFDVTLLEWHGGPGTMSATIWIKNDGIWLYLLFRVEWPANDTNPVDTAFIEYFWEWSGDPPPLWNQSDKGWVAFHNATGDLYGWDETSWYADEHAEPPGENNVEGAATHDGTYYWFEFKKRLDSADGCDWDFTPGEVIESVSEVQNLLVGMHVWDDGNLTSYEQCISLRLSAPADVNDDRLVDIVDIVIVALAFGSQPGDDNWDPRADVSIEYGLIDIVDIVAVAMHFGESYP